MVRQASPNLVQWFQPVDVSAGTIPSTRLSSTPLKTLHSFTTPFQKQGQVSMLRKLEYWSRDEGSKPIKALLRTLDDPAPDNLCPASRNVQVRRSGSDSWTTLWDMTADIPCSEEKKGQKPSTRDAVIALPVGESSWLYFAAFQFWEPPAFTGLKKLANWCCGKRTTFLPDVDRVYDAYMRSWEPREEAGPQKED